MDVAAYLFEIRQIQGFIFATGKLRDAAGASDLLDSISGDGPDDKTKGLAGQIIAKTVPDAKVFRAAGGALDLTCPSLPALHHFRAVFRLALADRAPGLVYSDSIATGADGTEARTNARAAIVVGGRCAASHYRWARPLCGRRQSRGSPVAVKGMTNDKGRCRITEEFTDRPTLAARHWPARDQGSLVTKFVPDGVTGLCWPNVFVGDEKGDGGGTDPRRVLYEPIPFPFGAAEMPRIAILHADANGMGAVTRRRRRKCRSGCATSQALTRATSRAVKTAMAEVIGKAVPFGENHVVPARPIILGGDDVSLILRADLAVDFALDFIRAFEAESRAALKSIDGLAGALASATPPPGFERPPASKEGPYLTTKVGIVVIGPNQPFRQAYELAESLCKAVRDVRTSRIAFHRVTGAEIPGSTSEIADGAKAGGFTLWRARHDSAGIVALRTLAQLLEKDEIGRGALRRVPEVLKTDAVEAQRLYQRSLDVVKGRNPALWDELEAALKGAEMPDLKEKPETEENPVWCPLLQAHDLAHIDRSQA
jgi:hypothetical protein